MSQLVGICASLPGLLSVEVLLALGQDRPGLISRTVTYIGRRSDLIWDLLLEHLWLIIVSILIAVVVSVILGVIISYKTSLAITVLTVCQIMMTIPSMAMLAFMVPLFGIGFTS